MKGKWNKIGGLTVFISPHTLLFSLPIFTFLFIQITQLCSCGFDLLYTALLQAVSLHCKPFKVCISVFSLYINVLSFFPMYCYVCFVKALFTVSCLFQWLWERGSWTCPQSLFRLRCGLALYPVSLPSIRGILGSILLTQHLLSELENGCMCLWLNSSFILSDPFSVLLPFSYPTLLMWFVVC